MNTISGDTVFTDDHGLKRKVEEVDLNSNYDPCFKFSKNLKPWKELSPMQRRSRLEDYIEHQQRGDIDADEDERPAKRTRRSKRDREVGSTYRCAVATPVEDTAAAPARGTYLVERPAPAPFSSYLYQDQPSNSQYTAPPDASARTIQSLAASVGNLTNALSQEVSSHNKSRAEYQSRIDELEEELAYYKDKASRRG